MLLINNPAEQLRGHMVGIALGWIGEFFLVSFRKNIEWFNWPNIMYCVDFAGAK